MKSLKKYIAEAAAAKKAIGHFNISTVDALWGIFEAAHEIGEPVIIGVSEGERRFLGVRQSVALVKSLREEYDYPIFLNADHSYSFESVKEAVDAGFDAVIFDGAQLSFEENIRTTKQCVEYARNVNPEIIIEGELGYIGSSSKLLDEIPNDVKEASLTTPEQAEEFVKETGADLVAPSVGNLHGMLKHSLNPSLDIALVSRIRAAAGVPLVLHGGSGISDGDFKKVIEAGVALVHINTEIRKAWRDAVRMSIQDNPDEVAPYKILQQAKKAVQDIVSKRIALFSRVS